MAMNPDAHSAALARAASALLAQLDAPQRRLAVAAPDDPTWTRWSYLPGDRPGLSLEGVEAGVLERIWDLVEASHSELGASQVRAAVEVERERRRTVSGVTPEGDRYWLRVHGTPGSGDPWSWRLNGHHVGVHVMVDEDHVTFTPRFIGAEPAHIASGPLAGTRLLGAEEDLARELLASLGPAQRNRAIFTEKAPDDILSGMDPVVDPGVLPAGLRRAELDGSQRRALDALVHRYLGRLPAAYARECWEEAMDVAGDDVAFAWGGGTQRGEGHYYCVTSPTFLIEYDNTQDGANHAHSVLRHLRDDFGGDALREHRRASH